MKINYVKFFGRIKNKWTNCLHISAQQTNKLTLKESLQTDACSVLVFRVHRFQNPPYLSAS